MDGRNEERPTISTPKRLPTMGPAESTLKSALWELESYQNKALLASGVAGDPDKARRLADEAGIHLANYFDLKKNLPLKYREVLP